MKYLNLKNIQTRAVELLVFLTLAVACAAQQVPAPRVVDLAATDGKAWSTPEGARETSAFGLHVLP